VRAAPVRLSLTTDEAKAALTALVAGFDAVPEPYERLDALSVACQLRAALASLSPAPRP
jgi:hypothetical protein